MVVRRLRLAIVGVASGNIHAGVPSGHRTPYTSSARRAGTKETERPVNGARRQMDSHDLASLDWVVAMIRDPYVDAVIEGQRRRVSDLLVAWATSTGVKNS